MVPVNPGFFLKITGTGIIITKKGPGFAGTGIPVGHYKPQHTHWSSYIKTCPVDYNTHCSCSSEQFRTLGSLHTHNPPQEICLPVFVQSGPECSPFKDKSQSYTNSCNFRIRRQPTSPIVGLHVHIPLVGGALIEVPLLLPPVGRIRVEIEPTASFLPHQLQ